MATVRITKDLTSTIINKLTSQFSVRRDATKKYILEGFQPMIELYKEDLLTVILEQYNMPRETYDAIPDGWCHRVSTLKASSINGVEMGIIPSVTFPEGIKVPANLYYQHESLRLEHPLLQQYAEYANIANAQLSELHREERAAVSEANHLLRQCGSLKQALEAWPHLMELLPDWAIQQHKQPAEKREKREIVKVDADKLTGAIVAGKLAVATLNR
jgi:hypothetical protein